MSDLGPCDVCGKPGRWAVVVTGCSEHKIALKAAVENCNSAQHTQPKSEPQCSMCGHSQPCGHRHNSIYCRKWYAAHLQASA